MDNEFHYDPAEYHEQVSAIAEHVILNENALPTFAPRIDFESNSYHGAAIKQSEQKRLSLRHPRLYR